MNDNQTVAPTDELSFRDKHRFLLLIIMAILVTTVLVLISMTMYYSSGAAQLDLSRPGYKGVRAQVEKNDSDFQNYSASGSITQDTISEFMSLYSKQAQKTKAVDAFGGDPLSPESLGINDEVEQPSL
jgi:hypothetical protein